MTLFFSTGEPDEPHTACKYNREGKLQIVQSTLKLSRSGAQDDAYLWLYGRYGYVGVVKGDHCNCPPDVLGTYKSDGTGSINGYRVLDLLYQQDILNHPSEEDI